jgi:hypothetical protein
MTTHRARLLRALCWVLALSLCGAAAAQGASSFKDGYAQGYKDGFDAGYQKAAGEQSTAAETASKGFPIAVQVATYGPDGSRDRCDATHYVRKLANGRRSVSVDITNSMCGDPAPGKRKGVEITYLCGAIAKTASAYEHRSAYLYCD